MIQINLRTETVPLTRRVWRLFPGRNYKFLPAYFSEDAIFLDFPGLPIDSVNNVDPEIDARLIASQQIGAALRTGSQQQASAVDYRNYLNDRASGYRTSVANSIHSMFRVANKEDIVVVPTTLRDRTVHIGKLLDKPSTAGLLQVNRYPNYPIPYRSVQWLAQVDESKVSSTLAASLRNQHPFVILEKSLFPEVFSLAYKNYVFGDRSGSVVFNN